MSKILLAEDDPSLRELLTDFFQQRGDDVVEAIDGPEAIQQLDQHIFDLILAELRLPGRGGIDVLRAAKSKNESTPVFILTSPSDAAAAGEALKLGAYDYLLKRIPLDLDEIRIRTEKALEYRRMAYAIAYLQHAQRDVCDCDRIIGYAAQLQKLLGRLRKEVSTASPIMITGEPGSGKGLLAAAIHANSPRRHRTFVQVNCAARPEHLLESELFGHEEGAFPGADRQRIGWLEQANLGTLVLHKIEAMSPGTQVKTLRVLQERTFERLGSSRTIAVDVRIIANTNRGLKQATREGRFRADLYARLNVISVGMPALRQRPEDILPLANFFVQKYNGLFGRSVKAFDAAAQRALLTYPWPGNMRELEMAVARSVLLAAGEVIDLSGLGIGERHSALAKGEERAVKLPPRGISLKEIERQTLLQALEQAKWVQKAAAVLLDISPRVMNYKLQAHGITHAKWSKRR